MRLEKKIAIITGAGSGIGKETAKLFAKEGASVVVAEVNEAAGREVASDINKSGGEASFFNLDVSKREMAASMAKFTMEKYGRIDILINNAGIIRDAFLTKMTEQQWDDVMQIDLKGVFNCTQAVAQIMMDQGSGVIVNASSISGIYGNIGQANYAAAKAGLIGMTKALAKELGRKGVRVNAVTPGFIVTPMTAQVPEKVLGIMKDKTPLQKLGDPIDVAYAYLYLASDEARYVNGSVLDISGGLCI